MAKETDINALKRPFSDDEVEWRIDRGGKKKNGELWVMIVPYADARAVMSRLDEAVGIANWRAEYDPVIVGGQEGWKCHLFLRLDGEWIDKCDVTGLRPRETVKAAFSDALKRAAVHWGIARDLYDIEGPIFAHVGQKGRFNGRINLKKSKSAPDDWVSFRWSPPPLDEVRKHRAEPEEPQDEDDTPPVMPPPATTEPEVIASKNNPTAQEKWLLYYQNHPGVTEELKVLCQKARLPQSRLSGEKKQEIINHCAASALEAQGKARDLTSDDIPFGGAA